MSSEQFENENHEHNFVLKEKKEVNCIEDGYELYVCEHCKEERKILTAQALGHSCKAVKFARTKSAMRRGVMMECTRENCNYKYKLIFQNKDKIPETGQGPEKVVDKDYFEKEFSHFHCGADISKVKATKIEDEEGKYYLLLE